MKKTAALLVLLVLACNLPTSLVQTVAPPTETAAPAETAVPPTAPPTPTATEAPTPTPPTDAPTATPVQDTAQGSEKRCGDGVCDGPETAVNCAADCAAEAAPAPEENSAPSEAGPDAHWVVNPASGARLFVQVLTPLDWDGAPLPALVLIPGGSGDGSHFTQQIQRLRPLFDAGFALVVFDPDGRGRSEGEEDDNGFIHQDGLAAVITYAAGLPEVDAARIGVVSYSYGITMAAGTLARRPDLPVRFLIDWEGPADRRDTGGCDADHLGHLDVPCDDDAFWSQREAAAFAHGLRLPYLRLQSAQDHVQPDNNHALLMIANATAAEYGGSGQAPWTRLNNLAPNTVYAPESPPPMLPEAAARDLEQLVADSAVELRALFATP
jgi:pimeloyl-ACP methyl ester carboxylesterase